jgi:diaminopimelate decarboxylase
MPQLGHCQWDVLCTGHMAGLPSRRTSVMKAPMRGFERDAAGQACLSGTPVMELLAAARAPTPAYLYDIDAISTAVTSLVATLGDPRHLVAYAVKANSAGSILRAVAAAGAGADVVSGAELQVACACGVAPDRVVMSGVAKTDAELDLAIESKILAVQVESLEEIDRLAARARAASRRARVALRVNPGVDAQTHAHVATGHDAAKFGIALADVGAAWERIDRSPDLLQAVGLSTHVGSNLRSPRPYLEAAQTLCTVARARCETGRTLEYLDFGGGFGIDYGQGAVAAGSQYVSETLELVRQQRLVDLRVVIEPGRFVVGPHGVLIARVVQSKESGPRRWVMLDAGMNDLLRPALYQAWHRVEPVEWMPGGTSWRVVGPVCESADDFGSHALGAPPPTAVVIRDAGAYGFAMASQYNGRPLPSEVFVAGGRICSVSQSLGAASWVRNRLDA